MTRLGIITQFLSRLTHQSEEALLDWAWDNIDPCVLSKLKEEISREEVDLLVKELEKSPEAFLSLLFRQISRDASPPHKPTMDNSHVFEASMA